MGRALITLNDKAARERAMLWIVRAPHGTRVEFKASKRTVPQSDRMWAALTDVANQLVWHGKKLAPTDWKLVFLDALNRELRLVPNIDGTGFVNLGRSSSDLDKQEMSSLIEIIQCFGAQHGVIFRDPEAPPLTPSQGNTTRETTDAAA